MARKKNEAFDVGTPEEHGQWVADWCRDIDDAFTARESVIGPNGLIAENDWFFEQGKGSSVAKAWVDGADLTSPIITETVETMQSQLLGAVVKAEPFCTVDGWGPDAKKAPLVESFHEWQVDEEGLKEELGKVLLGALLEDCCVIEVRERIETRKLVEEINVAVETADGGAVFTADGKPALKFQDGEPVIAQPGEASAKVRRTSMRTKLLGPEYDVISMRDFVFLPGHAKNQRECYGYAYRIWVRVPILEERAMDGIYDKDAVKSLGDSSDRTDHLIPPVVDSVAAQYGPTVEKELMQLAIHQDLDGDGREEWYVATINLRTRTLLRLKLDTFVMEVGKPRCVPVVLFPRRDSVYGYCFADKMKTSAWEDTALRNMIADRSALSTNAPTLVTQGSTWDPDTQPMGVGRVITGVKSPNEISFLQIPDVPNSAIMLRQDVWRIKERVSGLADAVVGVLSDQQRTLGENQLAAAGSSKRVEYPLGHFRRAIQHIMELRQAIWVRALDGMPKGMDAPSEVVDRLQAFGNDTMQDGRFTADMLRGRFRFKPFGSVDTADSAVRITYFNQGFIALGNILKMAPSAQALLNDPEVVMRILQEWARVYKVRDVNVFLKAFMKIQQTPQPMGMPSGVHGAPMLGPPQGAPAGASNGIPPQLLEALSRVAGGQHVN